MNSWRGEDDGGRAVAQRLTGFPFFRSSSDILFEVIESSSYKNFDERLWYTTRKQNFSSKRPFGQSSIAISSWVDRRTCKTVVVFTQNTLNNQDDCDSRLNNEVEPEILSLGPEVDVGKKGSDPYQRAFAPDTKSIAKKSGREDRESVVQTNQ